MAKSPANLTRAYLDQYNISGDINGWSQALTQELLKVDTLSDAGPRRLVGNYDEQDEYTGFVDTADDAYDEIVHALLGSATDHYYGKVIATSISSGLPAENSIAYECILHLTSKPMTARVDEAELLNLQGAGANGTVRGVVLRAAAVTGTGAGTGRNLGATTSGQTFQAIVRVLSVSGAGSITIRVQESSDDAAADPYADISGMTVTATGVGVTRLTTTAATEAWKRINVQAFSGFTSVTILVTVGTVQGT